MSDESGEYITLDGSKVLELIRPGTHGSERLSLARATVEPDSSTLRHRHEDTEEVYYILSGEGALEIGARIERVGPGDARLIPPGVEHRITAMGSSELVILCACSPPYRHEDTTITEAVKV